jgi:hypothetical protein
MTQPEASRWVMPKAVQVPARGLHARYIGQLNELRPFAVWHLGRDLDRALCGRRWKEPPALINSDDVYDREWCCSSCLRSAARLPPKKWPGL